MNLFKAISLIIFMAIAGTYVLAISNVSADTSTGFIEAGGVVAFEGEHFDSNIGRNGHTWTSGSDANAVGGTFINTPNDGLNATPPNSAETQYLINFSTTGTYYVWLRGYAPSGTSNAIGAGLDGASTTTPVNFAKYDSWVWDDTDSNGTPVKITVSSAGIHTFSVWEKKDGTKLDRVVLSTSSTAPSGNGPAESPKNAQNPSTTPTGTITPTPSISTTPTPTAIITPTPTVTSTPTPTPTKVPTPTPIPGQSTMNLKSNYSFNVNLNYGASKITVDQTVKITNKSNDKVSTLNFSVLPKAFGEFTLNGISVDGNDVDHSWTNNSNLAVNLNSYLNPGDQTTVKISFVLNPKSDTSTYLDALLSKANGVMEVGNWFPILSNGHAMRMPGDSQYTVTADSFHMNLSMDGNYPVAAPGTVQSNGKTAAVDFGPGRNFVFSVCPNCSIKTDSIDGIKVKTYYISGTDGQSALNKAEDALHTFDSKFVNYPYDTFVVAQAAGSKTANEFSGMVFVGTSMLNDIKHETSHQWFYGMLGNDQMNAPWLDEAFAEWAGLGFASHKYCSTKPVDSSIYDFPNQYDYSNDGDCGSYDQTVYYKGSTLIQGVRSRMGDSAFFNSLNNLFQNYKYGVITTSIVANNWLNYAPSGTKDSLRKYMQGYISW